MLAAHLAARVGRVLYFAAILLAAASEAEKLFISDVYS
jgi:hypothetical protein